MMIVMPCRHRVTALAAALLVYADSYGAAQLPPSPPTGSCTDCIGEVNGTLNACTLTSPACISSQNEDEDHFVAPWQYNISTDAAIDMLVAVATGKHLHASKNVAAACCIQ